MGRTKSKGNFEKEKMKHSFASDNNAGVSPKILEAILYANRVAKLLEEKLKGCKQLEIILPDQSNALFVKLPKNKISEIMKKVFFYTWNEEKGIVRWMTNFQTTQGDIEEFAKIVRKILKC